MWFNCLNLVHKYLNVALIYFIILMKICIPEVLKDISLLVIFPPLWVLIKELTNPNSFPNFYRIILSVILTSMFYFPGLVHALLIMRDDGPI